MLLGATLFAVYDWTQAKTTLAADLHLVADVLGTNMRSALEFQDSEFAEEELRKLDRQSNIEAAHLYDELGVPFVGWQRAPNLLVRFPGSLTEDGDQFDESSVRILHPIVRDGHLLGTLFLQSDLDPLYARMQHMLSILLAGWAACVGLSWFLASRLQHAISKPIDGGAQPLIASMQAGTSSPGSSKAKRQRAGPPVHAAFALASRAAPIACSRTRR
jgi:hypothetical protein